MSFQRHALWPITNASSENRYTKLNDSGNNIRRPGSFHQQTVANRNVDACEEELERGLRVATRIE